MKRLLLRLHRRFVLRNYREVESGGEANNVGDYWLEETPGKPTRAYVVEDIELDERGRPTVETVRFDPDDVNFGLWITIVLAVVMVGFQILTLILLFAKESPA